MICNLTIVRYPKYIGFAGFLSMAIFHFPLFFSKKISFYKLMGCGKNGTFDKTPDWRQWAVLTVGSWQLTDDSKATNHQPSTTNFLKNWFQFFNAEVLTIVLEPIEGHGFWDAKQPFGQLPKNTEYDGVIGVLTRATIRLNKLKNFWTNVDGVASQLSTSTGFITSFGIGEIPFIKQATFSVWDSKTDMKNFAYKMHQHADVVRKTHKENWYSEEMFIRFKPVACFGSINGSNPLKGKL